jgi:STE24 endopeptidase
MDSMHQYRLAILLSYLLVQGFTYWLELLNLGHMKKHQGDIPPGFEGYTDAGTLRKSVAYTTDKTRLGMIESGMGSAVMLVFIFGGLLDRYAAWINAMQLSFVLSGTVFFLILSYISTLLSIPFSLYGTFRIENRYGFNTMTLRLWVSDLVKSAILSSLLIGAFTAAGLWIVQASPQHWWLYAWGFFLGFSLLLMYVSPYIIEPLFNTFTPLEKGGLEEKIRKTMSKAGIRISSAKKVDASRRSQHTNAYFTGIGKVKRIVMYDTLVEKMNDEEIVAVLAHEIGHWKKHHILKRIIAVETIALCGMYISFRLLQGNMLAELFALQNGTFYAKLVLLSFIGGIIIFPFTALSNYISRQHEKEADRFSVELTADPESMATSLIKLSKDNLSNLHPHSWYAAFHYSHPPVAERIREIRSIETTAGQT